LPPAQLGRRAGSQIAPRLFPAGRLRIAASLVADDGLTADFVHLTGEQRWLALEAVTASMQRLRGGLDQAMRPVGAAGLGLGLSMSAAGTVRWRSRGRRDKPRVNQLAA
jgi:hypothetical protein